MRDFLDKHSAIINALATVAIVGLTLVYVKYSKKQWETMTESNRINRSSVIIAQRAFVFRSGFTIFPAKDNKTGKLMRAFIPQWENSGSTPATDVSMYVSRATPGEPLPIGFGYPDIPATKGVFPNANTKARTLIGPHATSGAAILTFFDEDLKKVTDGAGHAYMWGWVDYADAFGCRHKTEFCTEIVSFQKDQVFWNDCQEHNCPDRQCKDYQPTGSPVCLEELLPVK